MPAKKLSLLAAAGATALAVAGLAPVASHAAPATLIQGCVDSVPEPGTAAAVPIWYTIYRPATATAETPVPMIFHSHGWGGSRTNSATAFASWLDGGYGVISFDQRGFGASGGKAHVENPDFEGQDVIKLVDIVTGLDWVAKEAPGDPLLAAIGGSYGGGYQFVGAFTELRDKGATRFDALAPEITWWDLKESLAPAETVRSLWVSLLFATGADAHTDEVIKGTAYGVATGLWPKGEVPGVDLDAFFLKTGPAWHVANGRKLDIPVLFGQGITDNLFNLNQGLKNFDRALTPAARAKSIFVGYNGGHVLPSALPGGVGGSGDPCSTKLGGGSFATLSKKFFDETFKKAEPTLSGRSEYHIASAANKCLTVGSVAPTKSYNLGTIATPTAAGAPVAWKLADGPLTVAGAASVSASVTSAAAEGRAFFALSVGTNPADAKIVQNNMLPHREALPVVGAARTIELPGIGIEIPAGQSLFLTVSPVSDMSFGHGSRTPGAMVLQDAIVRVPVPAA